MKHQEISIALLEDRLSAGTEPAAVSSKNLRTAAINHLFPSFVEVGTGHLS